MINFNDVLDFWFKETEPKFWFGKDEAFDRVINTRFFSLWQQASCGELAHWRNHLHGRLAEIIVLDQFSRNLFRDRPEAFSQDNQALFLAKSLIAQADFHLLNEQERHFALLPFMHSENLADHQQAVELFKKFAPQALDFELQHKAIIERFGRYPHRNAVLGRINSDKETQFLTEEGSSF